MYGLHEGGLHGSGFEGLPSVCWLTGKLSPCVSRPHHTGGKELIVKYHYYRGATIYPCWQPHRLERGSHGGV